MTQIAKRRQDPAQPPGIFISLEGGEGSGKSTQLGVLVEWLRSLSYEVVATHEPGGTPLGERVRSLLLKPGPTAPTERAEALLYAADRAHHVATVVRPALERGAIVITDRYQDSSLAYQGAGRSLPRHDVAWLTTWAAEGLVPDLVVLLDIDPELGLSRAGVRGEHDRLETESLAFHRRVRQTFRELAAAEPARYLVVDASTRPATVSERIRARIELLLAAWPGAMKAGSGGDDRG